MGIERVGRHFIEVQDEDGNRSLIRINSIQQASDVDELRQEAFLTVSSRTILVRSPLDELKDILDDEPFRR